MPILLLPPLLQSHADNQYKIMVYGDTVKAVLNNLTSSYPDLHQYFFTSEHELGAFVNIYVNGKDIRYLNGLATVVEENDELKIIFSVAGG